MDANQIRSVALIFAPAAIAMFVYATFWSENDALREQGILWFLIALVASVLPSVSRLKFQDLEVEFRREIERVEAEVFELKGLLYRATEKVDLEESNLSAEALASRNAWWDEFQEHVDRLSGDERFKTQRLNSIHYLRQYGLSMAEVKKHLQTLGYYSGTLDDEFSPEAARAVEEFQRNTNMRHVDGIIGQLTLREIGARSRAHAEASVDN